MSVNYFFNSDSISTTTPIKIGNSNYVPNPFQWLFLEIDKFVALPNNWDGYDGIGVLPQVGETAKNFLRCLGGSQLDKISDIFPNPHGTITFEWQNQKGEKMSLEIGENNYSYFINYKLGNPKLVNGQNLIQDTPLIAADIDKLAIEEIPLYF